MMKKLFAIGWMLLMMVMNGESDMIDWTTTIENINGTDFEVSVQVMADHYGTYEEYGIIVWDDEGNVVVEDTQAVWISTEGMDVWYNVYDLQSGEEYGYQIYVKYDDSYYYSPVRFIQTGTVC